MLNRTSLKSIIFVIFSVLFLSYFVFNMEFLKLNLSVSHGLSSKNKFLNLTNIYFQKEMDLQSQGMALLNDFNGTLDLKATWELIPRHFNAIWHQQFNSLDILKLRSEREEHKYFLKFSKQIKRPYTCNVVTLGVGHSVSAELSLKKMYPDCSFLAADPASDINADLVEKHLGGKFIKAAVGGETIDKLTNVWEKDVESTGPQRKVVSQTGFFDFFRQQNYSLNPIDLLLIDVEGGEFGILEQLVDHPLLQPVPICQLNMEVHQPWELNSSTHARFFSYFDRLMRSRRYALLNTDIHPYFSFLRLFLVNVEDINCIQKFLP